MRGTATYVFRAGRCALWCGLAIAAGAAQVAAAGRPDLDVSDGAAASRPVLRASFAVPAPPPRGSAWASVRFDADAPPVVARPNRPHLLAGLRFDVVDQQAPARPRAFVYSDAYQTRAKIHRLASWAMLPLFGAEAVIGQQMFNDPAKATGGRRLAHRTIGYAIGGLFGVNTVTGGWNMLESRKDPNAGMRRTIHGVLMLVADGGFLATALTRPKTSTAGQIAIYDFKKNQHMALAYASVSVATVGYLIMLFK